MNAPHGNTAYIFGGFAVLVGRICFYQEAMAGEKAA